MLILGLHPIDVAVIAGSLLAILFIGVWVSRGVKHEEDFFVGGRSLGPVLQFFLNFGQMTDSSGAPTVATEVYRQGAAGMWIPFQPLFSTPFYWFSSIWWRRSRLITGPDQFIERFNSRRLATAFAWWGIVTTVLGGALGNLVSYKVAAAMLVKPPSAYTAVERQTVADFDAYRQLDALHAAQRLPDTQQARYQLLQDRYARGQLPSYISYLSPVPFYVSYTLIVMIYIMLGGIKAAAYTDAFQGILIIIFSILLIPVGLLKVGGFKGLHQSAPEYAFRIFGSSAVSDYTWYAIAAFVLLGTICIGAPVGCGSGRDERSLRIGVLGGAFGKRIVMIAWMFCALLALAMFKGGISDPDNTWGILSRSLLGPGLLGVMISGVLLGHMPAVGAGAVNFAATFTRNLYEPMFPGKSERHYMLVAKLSIAGVLTAGVVGALLFTGIITLFTTMVSIGAFFGAVGLLMLFWRRLTADAVGVSWIAWMVLLIVIPWGLPLIPQLRRLPALTLQTPERTVKVIEPATSEDVRAGRADAEGQSIAKTKVIPPQAVFFESVTHTDPADPKSPMEGVGRMHVELYLLHCIGLPLQTFTTAGLNCSRWLFDALGPFVLLMSLSYLLPARRKQVEATDENPERLAAGSLALAHHDEDASSGGVAVMAEPRLMRVIPGSAALDPAAYARTVMGGNIAMLHNPNETRQQEQIRLDRFYAKLKTPVALSPEQDELELTRTFADPQRFSQLKLFARSDWEFTKWNRADFLGFFGCWTGVFAVLGLLWLVLNIGA